MTFDKTIEERLIERNGWFGFINKGRLKIYEDKELLDISKPINNKETCEFIDMYPTRELFSFAPLYNNFRHRIERNWNSVKDSYGNVKYIDHCVLVKCNY